DVAIEEAAMRPHCVRNPGQRPCDERGVPRVPRHQGADAGRSRAVEHDDGYREDEAHEQPSAYRFRSQILRQALTGWAHNSRDRVAAASMAWIQDAGDSH